VRGFAPSLSFRKRLPNNRSHDQSLRAVAELNMDSSEDGPLKTTTAKILGLAADFDLLESLRNAKTVILLMAFAKRSGWRSIKDAVLSGISRVEILVGLNFEITDPNVLSDWLKLKEKDPYRFTIEVAPRNPVFHPMVILIEGEDKTQLAIVGSGKSHGRGSFHERGVWGLRR